MMSPLLERQLLFAQMVPFLLLRVEELGYKYTWGDAYRDPRCPYGLSNSLHRSRLAIDINLFKLSADGSVEYIKDDEGHRELGEWWESVGGTWGGRFSDPNHYSLEFHGVK